MRRLIVAICLALAGWSGLAVQGTLAAGLCVGSNPGCYTTIQAALNAAQNGDTIHIGKGTFVGGVTVDKSVSLVGAGATVTIISGGEPVLVIGHNGAPPEPTVTISGVTVTGGSNSSAPTPLQPAGGGILVMPATAGTFCDTNSPPECLGATVTINNSVITGNSVVATASTSCGSGCTFALPLGGGISNFGTLTLNNTTVSSNGATVNVTPVPSYLLPFGGGIETTDVANLMLHNSTVSGNAVTVTTTSGGIFAGGGGINADGLVTLDGSTVAGNSVSVSSTDPNSDIFGVGGGLRLTSSATATIRDSVITNNGVTATGVGGGVNVGANAQAGGVVDGGSILLENSQVSHNAVTSTITSASTTSNSASDAGGMEIDGAATIKDTQFIGNSATSTSPAATANGGASPVGGALAIFTGQPVTITDSVISGNRLNASTTSGVVNVAGGGINDCSSILTLRDTSVNGNSGVANGPANSGSTAQGGGIWSADCGGGPPVLTLIDSSVTHNSLTASSGITPQGGGLYTGAPVTLTNSVIAQNTPDQCFGC